MLSLVDILQIQTFFHTQSILYKVKSIQVSKPKQNGTKEKLCTKIGFKKEEQLWWEFHTCTFLHTLILVKQAAGLNTPCFLSENDKEYFGQP